MNKLLRLEYIKFTRSNIFYIFMGLFVAFVLLGEFISVYLLHKVGLPMGFPTAWSNLLYNASNVNFFMGIIVLVSITAEYQSKTFRQHVVDGLEKRDIFMAKGFYAFGVAFFASLFVGITVIVLGLVFAGSESHNIFDGMQLLTRYFVQLLGYISMAVFFGFLFRNTALAIIVYMFYVLFIEALIGGLITYLSHFETSVPKYFPKALFSDLVKSDLVTKLAKESPSKFANIAGPSDTVSMVVACGYIIVFIGASYALLSKRDL